MQLQNMTCPTREKNSQTISQTLAGAVSREATVFNLGEDRNFSTAELNSPNFGE